MKIVEMDSMDVGLKIMFEEAVMFSLSEEEILLGIWEDQEVILGLLVSFSLLCL